MLRKITDDELRLLKHLMHLANLNISLEKLMVNNMDDGGMGSLLLYPTGKISEKTYGSTPSEVEFRDADRSPVLASLNLDKNGDLFELDIWKINFDPLIRIPETFN